jgi:glycosyltransferase involved in cell wall biosynthesis
VAAQEAGLLRAFVTGIYDRGDGTVVRRLPGPLARRVARELRRRHHPALDPALVRTIGRYHVAATALRRGARITIDAWAHRRFDAAVARLVREEDVPPRIVHVFEGGGLETLRAARSVGAAGVLDVANAHERVVEALLAEVGGVSYGATSRVNAERAIADILLAPSQFVIDCLVEHGVPAERIVHLPYGVDPDRFTVSAPSTDGVFRALYVGRLCARKGLRQLLEAWRSAGLHNAELTLVGAADEFGRRMLRDAPASVRWVPGVPKHEVHRLFEHADAFVFPSLAEGSALVTYEALASGLPVVTTPNSGSVVRDDVDGFVVPAGDVEALGRRLSALAGDADLRVRLGRSGRALIVERYTWGHYRSRLTEIYRELL